MWLSSSICPSRPSKIVVIQPVPFPLHHLCLVAVCHRNVITHHISPPKDVEASGALCLKNRKAGPGPAEFIWGLPGNDVSPYIYMSLDFENFSALLLATPSLSRIFSIYCGRRPVVPRLFKSHGSFRVISYCRIPSCLCIMTQNATCSQDFEKGWAALSSPFCMVTSMKTWVWGLIGLHC